MRIAVMSDIHGFSLALETVLADLDRQGPFAEVIVAGDLCEVGPAPAEVLELLQARRCTVLQGNTDFDIVEAVRMDEAHGSLRFVIEQIGADGVDYLDRLPFSRRVTPPGGRSPADDLLVVHANPHNLLDRFEPDMSDRELLDVVGDERPGAIAFGHFHVCFVRQVEQTLLVDVSAVGNPKDEDLRCKYGILTWDDDAHRWHAELRKLPYPLEATQEQIRDSALPDPEKVIRKLKKASY